MAGGALLGVKILRRNAEHVVTLDAHTVKDRLPGRRGFVFGGVGLGLRGFGCHKQILAYRRALQYQVYAHKRAAGIPDGRIVHPNPTSERGTPPAVRLPPETLLEYQVLFPPVVAGRMRME